MVMEMFYEEKRENFIKYIIFFLLIIIIFLLFIAVMKIDYTNRSVLGNYSAQKLSDEDGISDIVESNFDEMYQNMICENEKKVKENLENMIEEASKSIVGISKIKQNDSSVFVEDSEVKLGLGSGVILSENGYILTNAHVVGDKYSNVFVTLENGRNYNANVVWMDSNIDLAIIKIIAYGLDVIKLGDSDSISVAEDVYAIGNPIGYEFQRTITKGIISGINRTIKIENEFENQYMEDLIQTDATINEGNSGGALINNKGELIGINTVKLSDADGIGFAVPINIVKPIIDKLLQDKVFEEAYLGLSGFDKEVIPYLNKEISIDSGIYVAKVNIDGPLFKENILEGDIILKIDDIDINKMNDLKKIIYSKKPGDKVKLLVKRNINQFELEVILGKK